jgi:hypothetical protein
MNNISTRLQFTACRTALWRIGSLTLLTFLFLSFKSFAQPIHVDGNPIDWTNFTTNYPNGHAITHDVANASNSTDDQFTNGAQDPDAISTWGWSLGNANNKGDITNAGALIYTYNNINYIAFCGDRTAINGDAAIGFWFFKNAVGLVSNGTFSGTHANGDLLVLSHFTNGGGMSQILLYQWQNGLQYVGTYNDAAVNSGPYPVPSPFTYTTSGGASGTYPTGAFFEGIINLSAIHASPCFANFMVETRNSQSINASLQDFAFGSFTASVPPPSTTGDIRCGAGTVNLSASGCTGGTLKWYDAATGGSQVATGTTYSPNISGTTTFYVSCTTAEGCTSDRTAVTGTIHALPTVTASAVPTVINLFAANHSSQLNAIASPAPNSLYNFSWTQDPPVGGSLSSTTIENPVFTATAAGTYKFVVTATEKAAPHCSAKDSVYVDVLASAPPCSLSGPTSACAGTTGLVFDGGTIPANFSFHWSVNHGASITSAASDSSSITVSAGSSNFTVTLYMQPDNTDLSPITCPWNVTVYPIPAAPSTTGDVRCGSGVVNLSASGCDGGTLNWYDAASGGNLVNTGATYSPSISGTTTYYVSCTSANGCLGPRASVTGTVNTIPDAPGTTGDHRCGPGVVNLSASGCSGGTLNWYDAASGGNLVNTGATYSPNISGTTTYYVSCTSADNCVGPRASVTGTVNPNPTCSLSAPSTLPGCSSTGNTLSVSGSFSNYQWTVGGNGTYVSGNGTNTVTYNVGSSGTITISLIVTDANGCQGTCNVSFGCVSLTEGCTIGFWKNHTYLWNSSGDPIAAGAGFTTGSDFYSYFGITSNCNLPGSLTMIQALNLGGGGCYNLARQAVGAALNIGAGLNYGYPGGLAQLKLDVAAAFNGGCNCSALATQLDNLNNNDQVCGRLVLHPVTLSPDPITNSDVLGVTVYPNPYTDKVKFNIQSTESGHAVLEVYNMMGQRVQTLYNGYLKAGIGQTIDYNVPENNRGNLIYILRMKDHKTTGKLIRPN